MPRRYWWFAAQAPSVTAMHRELSLRAIAIAEGRGAIDEGSAARLRAAVATGTERGAAADDHRAERE